MPRDVPIGNGTLLAAFDLDYRIRDFYYPRIGKENHALGYPWRLGIWVEGVFSWVNRVEWALRLDYLPDTLVTEVTATHARLPVWLYCNDFVDHEKNILLRCIHVHSLVDRPLKVRLYFHTDLNVMENESGDTVFFDPKNSCLIHYKGPRYFLMSCATEQVLGVPQFATGTKRHRGLAGTWKDAEDGELSGNPIAQGMVDSVVGASLVVPPMQSAVCHYWMAVGNNYQDVEDLHTFIIQKSPEHLRERNIDYWRRWVAAGERDFADLPDAVVRLYKRSLLILRTQIDRGGAIIAANDTDIWQFNQDTYSYMWPRDGAIIAHALDRAGYGRLTRRFLEFVTREVTHYNFSASILSQPGFLMHKYNPDGSVGSSWQPWFKGDEMQLPIQEDETALVIWVIWNHYSLHKDIEGIRPFYSPFVERAADFLLSFRDDKTGLPLPSHDLWEERRGIFAFTAATVVAGLNAAARLAMLFYEEERAQRCLQGAIDIKAAMDQHLYCADAERFGRGIVFEQGVQRRDATVDASLLGMVIFGGYDPRDERIVRTVRAIRERLWVKGKIGGLARYEGDGYQQAANLPIQDIPGNPWVICTLWLARYLSAAAQDRKALAEVIPLLQWAVERALTSGVLPEQVHPLTGEFLSVSPLTWSHAAYVNAVLDYLEKAWSYGRLQ